ncbi:hypothetical protein GJAV_G00142460 [Gymnothorax javanicus]|nr:hypothetical protein GJAV_G00142460 [Gymnothorax javanicus]
MSASLIRRGLELLSDDIKGVPENNQLKSKKNHAVGKPGVMDQISSNRQGVTKQIRRLQGQRGSSKNKATVKDKRIKYAVDEFRKKQKSSQMSQNLRYFMGQGFKAEQSDTHKILLHNKGRQSRNRPDRQFYRFLVLRVVTLMDGWSQGAVPMQYRALRWARRHLQYTDRYYY